MNEEKLYDLVKKFELELTISSIRSFGTGHINDTYLVETSPAEAPNYIIQRKNHKIFKNVAGMMENIVVSTNHIREKLLASGEKEVERKVMTYYPAKDGKMFVNDEEGNFWTLFLFIKDCRVVELIQEPEQAYNAARAFGHFQLQLSDLPGEKLIETIPNFHNGLSRLKDFQTAITADLAGRVKENQSIIDQILQRSDSMTSLQRALDDKSLPMRITHNDTKINNILFDQENNSLCVIDLDTVMPGSALYDFGDAIRTLGNTAPEDEPNLEKITFNKPIYEAFAKGYISKAKSFLTPKEIENLAFSCLYMAWEQAMRFFTDYLNGDTYYKTEYAGHNLVRTKAQLRYLEVLESNKQAMDEVILAS
ncbi:MAG: aminoglycoside phosphotransferase family protein [Bacteroidia bacterium]|nr:aminoglycoside phosphotransferase family protein [Bacteroidia bacterium]